MPSAWLGWHAPAAPPVQAGGCRTSPPACSRAPTGPWCCRPAAHPPPSAVTLSHPWLQLPITWLFLPTPPVVFLMQDRLRGLAAAAITATGVLRGRSAWHGGGSGSSDSAATLPPGDAFARVVSQTSGKVQEVLVLYGTLVAACAGGRVLSGYPSCRAARGLIAAGNHTTG